MRVCLDTNVLISYLIHPTPNRAPAPLLQAAANGQFNLVINETLLDELRTTVRRKPYLSARMSDDALEALASFLDAVATVVPEIVEAIPSVTRDPGDDYLIAHALTEKIDFLVSGDRDLLVLTGIEGLRIVSPSEFVDILNRDR